MDPLLTAACSNLAIVQIYRGNAAAARRTGKRCQRIFPDPKLAADLESLLARAG